MSDNLKKVITSLKALKAYYDKKATTRRPLKLIRYALIVAIECVEKQIPKKVKFTDDKAWGNLTKQPIYPVCDCYLTMTHFIGEVNSKRITYCDTCGNAIDWSVEE